ncbi:ParB N-terminal domain-containing protein (plasmid) [Vibrio scophthalmi]|uniref:ParB N-terminal domain-containing protein n=1 Tax=Vibrio scophthalmi TaxID=45658 RepID=UPI003EB69D22
MPLKQNSNATAEIARENSLLSSKKSKDSLRTVRDLLAKLAHTRTDVLSLLGVTEGNSEQTKSYKLFGGKTVKAVRVEVPYSEFQNYSKDNVNDSKVAIHPLNKRNQKGLNKNNLAELIESILERGIQQEGLAVEVDGRYLIIDSSRRFSAAQIAQVSLPLWVFPEGTDLSNSEIRALAHVTTLNRALSYREEGKHIYDYALLLGIDLTTEEFRTAVESVFETKLENGSLDKVKHNLLSENESETALTFPLEVKIENVNYKEALYEAIRLEFRMSVGDKTIQRYLDAAMVSQSLIELFPDYESINNKSYSGLKKTCREIATKLNKPFKTNVDNELSYYVDIEPLIKKWLKDNTLNINVDETASVSDQQKYVQATINELLVETEIVKQLEPTWSEAISLSKKDEHKYATLRNHKNGRVHEIKLSRPTSIHLKLHTLMAEKFDNLSEEQTQQLLKILESN